MATPEQLTELGRQLAEFMGNSDSDAFKYIPPLPPPPLYTIPWYMQGDIPPIIWVALPALCGIAIGIIVVYDWWTSPPSTKKPD